MENQTYSIDLGRENLKVNLNNFAALANGSVFVEYGQTVVLISAVMSKHEVDWGYLPLIVDFEERYYAAGKIRGPRYIKRE
jgi:polyribonucleotide nucleotidyltransferase